MRNVNSEVDQVASAALIDALAAELIDAGLVDCERLADRIESSASHQEPARQNVLLAPVSGLRRPAAPVLRLVTETMTHGTE